MMTAVNSTSPAFNLRTLVRPNILVLEPYRCARDDYKTGVLLDANENAYGPSVLNSVVSQDPTFSSDLIAGLHRYPDPHQEEVKQKICDLRNASTAPLTSSSQLSSKLKPLSSENLYVGVGSDECIDTLIRCFAAPGRQKLLTCPPTYGMYAVAAQVNDVKVVKVNLELGTKGFPVRVGAVLDELSADPDITLVYLCSPGNPTASLVSPGVVEKILAHPTWNGIVVADEAYIDFAPDGSSLAPWVTKYDNLVVLQTLSKAFGMAGIRLGVAYASAAVARILNNVKAPYNISSPTSELALKALSTAGLATMRTNIAAILEQRNRLVIELAKIGGVGEFIGGDDANFLLFRVLDKPDGQPSSPVALKLYERLAQTKGVVIRFRGKEPGCEGGLRVTIGTKEENDVLLAKFAETLAQIYDEK
ncbi:pyridoxal phosphate-dependent transferase [Lipomyces japonicus]|uniref:pyridoxal phosphate-dependent transferase n=1 Tax=Lipomyces japonicus TaxID=56871 RepID=UPI0034CD12C9